VNNPFDGSATKHTRSTVMIEKYCTHEKPEDLRRRERGPGAGAVGQTEREWGQLIAMLELAQRWQELVGEFTGEGAHLDDASADLRWSSPCSNDSECSQISVCATPRGSDS
jgi:hypothetical protein